jgi:hypothetical protein
MAFCLWSSVGAGLLAMKADIQHLPRLTHRYREQAHSYKGSAAYIDLTYNTNQM